MNIDHLKYFYDATKSLSLKKAATLNNISPGAVSQAIIKLEQVLNVKLLHHSKNSFQITEHGQRLYELCPKVLASIHDLHSKMDESTNPYAGKIYFGTQQSIASTFLPGALRLFNESCPLIEVNFTLGHSTQIKDLLDHQELDFAISMDNLDYENHPKIPIFTGEFVLISKTKIPKNKRKEFLVTGETNETKRLKTLYEAKFAETLPIKMKIDSWGVIKKMALEGHGIGFIPDYLLQENERRFIRNELKLSKIKYSVCCFYPENFLLNEKSLKFLEIMKKTLL